jgi:hypothetical protein
MIVRAVCHTKTSTLPGRESWQRRGFLAANDPHKVLIYLIYLATLSTLPGSLPWQPRSAVGSLDRYDPWEVMKPLANPPLFANVARNRLTGSTHYHGVPAVRADHKEPLVGVRLSLAAEIAKRAAA